MTGTDGLLDALLVALGPLVDAAASSTPETPAATMARVYADPLAVEVAHHDRAGRVRYFRIDDPGAAVADALAEFLTDGLRTLPAAQQRSARALVAQGKAEWIAIVDVDAGSAGGVLLPADEAAEAVLLFVLHRPDTLH